MADSNAIAGVYQNLTEPIRERPGLSLLFFAALLAVFYFGRAHIPTPEPYGWVFVYLLFTIPCAGLILSVHRLVVMRDDPSGLKKPEVLEEIKNSFVGRDDDAKDLSNLILSSYQVWLNGDSGVGKSVLIQKAVIDRLKSENVGTVYINSWRGDWELAPAAAVLAQLKIADDGNPLEKLEQILAASPGRVIILDQFDEYQIEHRDKFIPERGQVISRAQLEASNRFIRILNAAARKRQVRCVYVTRLDVEWGKRAVLFEDADEKYLTRLKKNVVEGEIERIVPSAAVENPGNGWERLREKLCSDLEDGGILPVQMRFAVLGLDELRHSLTVSAYVRMGGVPGLISRYIEREIRRVAADRAVAVALFPLLDRMVTLDGKATASIAEEELVESLPADRRKALLKSLGELVKSDIVRQVSNEDGVLLWRLDHDYLASPVREISRRQLPEQWELKDRLQRYDSAPAWQKPLKLADPVALLRLARARLRKGLRFGPALSWFCFSFAALLLVLAVLTYAVFGIYQRSVDEKLGNSQFSIFTDDQRGLWNTTTESEGKALIRLIGSRFKARTAFLATALETGGNAKRLEAHLFALAVALSRTNSSDANELYRSVIENTLTNPESDASMLSGAFGLMSLWNTAGSLSGTETQKLASTLVERMSQEKDADALRYLADGLGALKDKVDAPTVQRAASTLVERMSQEKDAYALSFLADGLGALRPANLPQNQLPPVLAALQLPDARCSALLAFDQATQASELPKQLRNPLCREDDWKQLALQAAKISKQPIAQKKKVEGRDEDEIEVNFDRLSDYVWSGQPWYDRYKFSLPEIAALVFLIAGLSVIAFGLVKSRGPRARV